MRQTTIFVLLHVIRNAKLVACVIKRYAVRNAKIRPYAVRNVKIKQYQYARGRGFNFIFRVRNAA